MTPLFGRGGVEGLLKRAAPGAALWLLGLLVGAVTLRNWIQLNDEGLMLQAAARTANGEVPYRDFWWFYPPGQSYLLAAVWKLFGASLIPWRVVRAASDATVALLVWRLALRRSGRGPALAAWLCAVLAVSSATGPHPYPVAMIFSLGALLVLDRRPGFAGVLTGLVAIWRIEFAAFLGIGSVVGLLLRGEGKRSVPRYVIGSLGTAALAYVPMFLAAGVSTAWDLLVRYPLLEFGKYQTLPFPLVWDGGGKAQGLDLLAQIFSYHLPLVLVLTFAASCAALALIRRPGRWIEVSLGIFGFGMANYLVVRADAFHTGPLAIVDAVLAAWAAGAVAQSARSGSWRQAPVGRWRPRLALVAATCACVGLAWSIVDTGWKRVREVNEAKAAVAINLAVADGVREMPVTRCSLRGEPVQLCRTSDLVSAVRWVDAHTKPGDPIYVTTKRSDLVTAGAPLFYVLADRPNATRYDIAAPGVVTSAPVQREMITAIQRSGALVVRDSAGITAAPEPNLAGKSSGVTLLDQWLAKNYVEVARFGVWTALEPRSGKLSGGAAEAR